MSLQEPPTLLQLARQRLLKEEALAISALEDLPVVLFTEMFEEAFTSRSTKFLRAVVLAWPFPCLPAGALVKDPHLENLKAILDGLDVLITQKVRSRRSKLRVLDLTNACQDFWSLKAGIQGGSSSTLGRRQKQPVEICPEPGVKKHLKVVTDIDILGDQCDECIAYLLLWAQKRIGSIHLCCRRLHTYASPVHTLEWIFRMLDFACILELRLSEWWLQFTRHLVPYLKEMRNLQTFILERIRKPISAVDSEDLQEDWIITLLYLFSFKSLSLRHLYVDNVYFLEGHLAGWLRSLNTPLETLSITDCRLSQADLDYLPRCLNVCELKHLNLKSVSLSGVCPKVLGALLERVTSTLLILELENCRMVDSHFSALLPALSQCSKLIKVNFYYNRISLFVLKNLLHQTAKLRHLTQELYPAPLECCNDRGEILIHTYNQLCAELLDILRPKRKDKTVFFATSPWGPGGFQVGL